MAIIEKKLMTVDEFLVWAQDQPGRYELIDGAPIAMSPERVRHAETKFNSANALKNSIQQAKLPCRMMPDGMTVRISKHQAYEPDALVYCGERIDGDELEISNPIIVVEVLSPGTKHNDTGGKFTGYFSVKSMRHYLIIDAQKRVIIHHAKDERGKIISAVYSEGILTLDPPRLEVEVEAMFADAE